MNNPRHIGIIMDGNRRWAKAQGLAPSEGHSQGYKILRDLSLYTLLDRKIPFISVYVFSTENWARTKEEVGFLMGLVSRALDEYLDEFHQKNIKVLVLGTREKLSPSVIKALDKAEATTKDNTGGTLALCFNYGGQAEIVDAAKKLMGAGLKSEDVTAENFAQALYHPEVPPLDLIIRTSGEQRLSGYMLWRAAYAELLFVNKHWPQFSRDDIDAALKEYKNRQRRYGK